jgi:serine protease Do
VFEDSPAEKAKLKHGDVILRFDGVDIKEFDDLPRRVANTPPGSAVDMVVMRNGKEKKLSAVIEKMNADPIELAGNTSPGLDWGFDVQNLSPPIAEQLGLEKDLVGVVITDVEPESAAQEAGLQRGDVILEANRKAVRSVGDLEDLIGDDEDPVLLVRRDDGTLYVPLTR